MFLRLTLIPAFATSGTGRVGGEHGPERNGSGGAAHAVRAQAAGAGAAGRSTRVRVVCVRVFSVRACVKCALDDYNRVHHSYCVCGTRKRAAHARGDSNSNP